MCSFELVTMHLQNKLTKTTPGCYQTNVFIDTSDTCLFTTVTRAL